MKSMQKILKKNAKILFGMFPMILGVVMTVSWLNAIIPKSAYKNIFTGNTLFDPILGAIMGSISAGTPVVSYVISGELLKNGVTLSAVTAFILAWVTVGFLQIPIESKALGKKFAILRNIGSFIIAIITAIIIGFIF